MRQKITGEKPKATPGQVKYLHGLYRAVGWDSDQYHFVLDNDYGVASTKDLTMYEAGELIRLLKAIVGAEQADKATDKQCALIRFLWIEIDYSKGEKGDLHLNKFIQKRFKKGSIDQLTKKQAISLIKMIKQMAAQAKEREGKTTTLKKIAQCEYCGEAILWVQLKDGERVPFDFTIEAGEYKAVDFHNCKKLNDGSKNDE